ncbi:hypothetical protein ACFFIG_09485 [Paraburkholderia rhizosphaerae]|uniref:hypothetical protein n=1 Tax=Paraburkholderia rhizosphaerae TaxID=480658 RepID=UPI0035EADD45
MHPQSCRLPGAGYRKAALEPFNETHAVQCDAAGRTARRHRRWAKTHRYRHRNRRPRTAQRQHL